MNKTTLSAEDRRRTTEEKAARNELFASDSPTPSLRPRYQLDLVGPYSVWLMIFWVTCWCNRTKKPPESDEQAEQSVTEDLLELRQMMEAQLQQGQDTLQVLGK